MDLYLRSQDLIIDIDDKFKFLNNNEIIKYNICKFVEIASKIITNHISKTNISFEFVYLIKKYINY